MPECNIGNTTTSKASCRGEQYVCHRTNETCLDFSAKPLEQNCSGSEGFKKENQRRKEHLENICKSGEMFNNRKLHIEARAKEMFYFDKVKYGWCPSYKAASSSVISHLCPLYYETERCQDKKRNGAELWRKNSFTNREGRDSIKNFIVVRDPFTRILSAFKDKLENFRESYYITWMYNDMIIPNRPIPQHLSAKKPELKESAKRKSIEKHKSMENPHHPGPYPDPNNPYENPLRATFPEFISSVIMGLVDPHWTSVNLYCAPCHQKFDYIIKVSDFTCEFNNFLKETGHGDLSAGNTELWATNKGLEKSATAMYEYYSQLTYDQLDQFYNVFLEDCLMFDFKCEETLCKIKNWKRLHEKDEKGF